MATGSCLRTTHLLDGNDGGSFYYVPVDCTSEQKNLRKKHGHCSHISWDQIKFTNHLPSREESLPLPPPLLTECHSMWMHTIQHLSPLVHLCPYAQVTRRSLAQVGYSTMLPSWPSRPLLLSGDAASRYLSSLIKPGARKFKYRCIVPKATPKPLPPRVQGDVQLGCRNSCRVLLTQLRWGSTRESDLTSIKRALESLYKAFRSRTSQLVCPEQPQIRG